MFKEGQAGIKPKERRGLFVFSLNYLAYFGQQPIGLHTSLGCKPRSHTGFSELIRLFKKKS
jgi:hypothetical protein